jgi:hypothetical protein
LPWSPERLRTDAEYNAALGQAYFQKQLQDFGDPALAVAAYNAGPARVRRAVERGGANWQAHVPAETRQYLQNVLGPSASGTQTAAIAQPGVQSDASAGMDFQQQAATGVIRAPQKAPEGYQWTPGGGQAPIPGGPGDKSAEREDKRFTRVTDLRKEFHGLPEVKEFNTVRGATQQIGRLATSVPHGHPGRAQADMAMVFTFMKTLDPTSTVREGEYASAKNAAGVPERIRNQYNATLTGEFLSPQQRQGMVKSAHDVYLARAQSYNEKAQQYHGFFRELGVADPRPYAPLATPRETQPPASKPGPAGQPAQIRIISRRKVQ